MKHVIFVLLGAGLLVCLSHEALVNSPRAVRPYKTIVGQYVFVMLTGYCQNVPQEVEMTDAEWSAFQAKRRKGHHRLQQLSQLDPCAMDNERGSVSASRVRDK